MHLGYCGVPATEREVFSVSFPYSFVPAPSNCSPQMIDFTVYLKLGTRIA